uniref:TonB-dependent receptor plug domain-containing protein n=1 Tax=Brevundimonas sp. TaxID=1871086 RepID=UPI002637B7CC
MIRLKTILMAGAAMAAISSPVMAQTAPAQPAQQTPPARSQPAQEQNEGEAQTDAVTDVVVTGNREETRTSIDSVSYSLDTDLQATTGSLADALRNVPSVDVDPEGNVSLRGDANVTILVDGRPSGILSGAGRGQAIQQLPAGQYSRIEVMTNPSAAYSPEGSGGVINLITRPNAPRPGRQTTGSIRVNVGDDGRWNAGVSGSIQEDRLTLSGDISYRADPVSVSLERIREQFNPATGALLSTTTTVQEVENDQSGVVSRVT